MIYPISNLKRTTDTLFLLGSGSSINEITPRQWDIINETDSLALNNFFYHPTFIPKFLSLELKTYDYEIARERIAEKWERGWKDVCYILPKNRVDYISIAIGHEKQSKLYYYESINRGNHPKESMRGANNDIINANHKVDCKEIYKSYNASTSCMVHLAYKMGYKKVILWGIDCKNSKYFWTNMDPIVRGKVHDLTNKAREGKNPNEPHNASHMRDYIIDFNKRWMVPVGREIVVGHKSTSLFPALRKVDI